MPLYTYRNEQTGEEIELLQSVHDKHEYNVAGEQWNRVFHAPQIAIDVKAPTSASKYLEKTSKGGTVGDMWEIATESAHKRADKNGGVDPLSGRDFNQKSRDIVV